MSDNTPVNPSSSGLPARIPARPASFGPGPGKPRNDGISPLFVLHAMRRWWKIAAPIGILLAVASAGTVFVLFKKTYLAAGQLRIRDQQIRIIDDKGTDSGNKRFVQTQLQLLKLDAVLRAVLKRPEIEKDQIILEQDYPLEYLKESISVKAEGDSEIYTISYKSVDPDHAAKVLNALFDEFMKYNAKFEAEFRTSLAQALDREVERWTSTVKTRKFGLQRLCEETGLRPTPEGSVAALSAADESIANLDAILLQADVDILILTAEINAETQMGNAPQGTKQPTVDRAIANQFFDSRADLAKRQKQMEQLKSSKLTESNRVYQMELAKLKADEDALKQREAEFRDHLIGQLHLTNDSRLGEMQLQLAIAQATKTIAEERKKKALADSKLGIGGQIDVDIANRELLQAEAMHKRLVEQRGLLIAEENAPSRVYSLNGPTGVAPPTKPIKLLPIMEMLLAICVSLTAPFGLAVAWELTVKRVNGVNDIRQQLGMPILGEIAVLPSYAGSGRHLSRKAHLSRQLFQESVDSLRTTLMLANSMHGVQVIAVASAVSGEGKTSVATHLAMSLAHTTGKPILLIDGDLRAPDIHHVFDVVRGPGLAEVLTGEAPLENAVAPSGFAQLDVLPAGELTTNPHRLLHNGEFRALLDSVREKYAYILIDMPPVLAASEALVLANQADATVLCALRDRSRLANLQDAQARLADAGAKTIGIVMSGLPTRHYYSRYGSYAYGTTPES